MLLPARSNGYTLVELLVVIAILGLVTAIATPAASTVVETAQFRADVYLVMTGLRHCQDEASFRQQIITLSTRADLAKVLGHHESELTGQTVIEFKAPLSYFPDGTSSGGTIELHRGSRHKTILVAWITGALIEGES